MLDETIPPFTFTQDAKGQQHFQTATPFFFESGDRLAALHLVFETYGSLNADRNNVILVHHSLSMSAHVQSHPLNPEPGWWEGMIGPQKTLDTNHYFVICINNLGSSYGSSSPLTINPGTQLPYRTSFPPFTFDDIVNSQKQLLMALGITHIHAIVSYSMGAMISLTWAQRYPDWVDFLVIASCCYRAYPTNLAWRQIQREIITLDPNWQSGGGEHTYKIARKIAMLNYRTSQELDTRFLGLRDEASLENYLNYNAEKFSEKTDVFCYLYTLMAMDRFNLVVGSPNRKACFEKIKASTLLISVNSDVLYPPMQQADLRDAFQEANRPIRYITHNSLVGHDAFIIDKTEIAQYISFFFCSR